MQIVDHDFVAHVAAHVGTTDLAGTRQASEVVLGAFGARLPPADRACIASELPASLGAVIEHASASVALPVEAQLGSLGLTVGRAREVVASVCHVLGEHLSDDALGRLQRALPASLAAFAVRPAAGATWASGAGMGHTLAEGRQGSHAPLSEQRADRTQKASIAAANPHGDVKLSSAVGSTQEREHETLAEGHPVTRPLSTGRS